MADANADSIGQNTGQETSPGPHARNELKRRHGMTPREQHSDAAKGEHHGNFAGNAMLKAADAARVVSDTANILPEAGELVAVGAGVMDTAWRTVGNALNGHVRDAAGALLGGGVETGLRAVEMLAPGASTAEGIVGSVAFKESVSAHAGHRVSDWVTRTHTVDGDTRSRNHGRES